MADFDFILSDAGEAGCIPNALIAKAMRMSMENKSVLLPPKGERPGDPDMPLTTPPTEDYEEDGDTPDANLAGSLYYANGFYNAVSGTEGAPPYYVPRTTRVDVSSTIASGSVLTFNRTENGGAELTWNASTGGVTISFDTSTYEPSSAENTSTTYGKWINKSKDIAGSTWPALYRINLNLTSLSGQVITLPQLLVQLYETTTSGVYNAVSCSMTVQKTGNEVVLSLYSNKTWAGIASILQTGRVIPALEQQRQN